MDLSCLFCHYQQSTQTLRQQTHSRSARIQCLTSANSMCYTLCSTLCLFVCSWAHVVGTSELTHAYFQWSAFVLLLYWNKQVSVLRPPLSCSLFLNVPAIKHSICPLYFSSFKLLDRGALKCIYKRQEIVTFRRIDMKYWVWIHMWTFCVLM